MVPNDKYGLGETGVAAGMMWERCLEAMLRQMFGCSDETLSETALTETVKSMVQRA
jgi:hypothetical protein